MGIEQSEIPEFWVFESEMEIDGSIHEHFKIVRF